MENIKYKAYNDKIGIIKEVIKENADKSDEKVLSNFCEAAVEYTRIPKNSANTIELEMQVLPIDYESIINDNYSNSRYKSKVHYTENDIRTIKKYISFAGFKKNPEKTSTFLRITPKKNPSKYRNSNLNEKEIKDPSNLQPFHNFRVCVDEKGIPNFCEDNDNAYVRGNNFIHYELKNREVSTYTMNSYRNVRINMKKETDITSRVKDGLGTNQGLQIQAAAINNEEWKNEDKLFRYIKRVSFYNSNDKDKVQSRIDISTVYQSEGKSWTGIRREKKPTYEVEIESVLPPDNSSIKGLNNNEVEETMKSLKFALKSVLCGVQDSHYPIKSTEMFDVSEEFKAISLRISPVPWYNGPQPVTLQRGDLPEVCRKDEQGKFTYNITNKADGTRKLMYISDAGKCYLVDRKKRIQYTGIKLQDNSDDADDNNKTGKNILLDGEYINLNKGKGCNYSYNIFDIYLFNNESCMNDIFVERENKFKSITFPLGPLGAVTTPIPSVKCKVFYTLSKDQVKLLKSSMENETSYSNDGMILTPLGGVPGNKSQDPQIFKWKEVEDTTIDFKVRVVQKNIVNRGSNGTEAGNEKRNVCNLLVSNTSVPIKNACNLIYTGKTYSADTSQDARMELFEYDGGGDEIVKGICQLEVTNNYMFTSPDQKERFKDGDIVEFKCVKENGNWTWIPIRVRTDKIFPNAYETAFSNFAYIMDPVESLCTDEGKNVGDDNNDDDDTLVTESTRYYEQRINRYRSGRTSFHNFVKQKIILLAASEMVKGADNRNKFTTLIDYGVGRGGDLKKWNEANINYVYGIDYSKDNLEDDREGLCSRYIKMGASKRTKRKYSGIFVEGDCSKSIENNEAFKHKSDTIYTIGNVKMNISELVNKSIFKQINKGDILDGLEGVKNAFGKGFHGVSQGFDIGSSQFAMHYFFKSDKTVKQFVDNLQYTIKLGGYFIGTCFNGHRVLDFLESNNYSYTPSNSNIKIVLKRTERDNKDDSNFIQGIKDKFKNSLGGVSIVVSDSGFKDQEEYLVNFKLFDQLMKDNGFKKVSAFSFSELHNSHKEDYNMDDEESKISYLNDQFMYVKDKIVGHSSPVEVVPESTSSTESKESSSQSFDDTPGDPISEDDED